MKTQTLYKKLSLPLLLTVVSAIGIGVTPARSASLIGSQQATIDTNPEATLIAGRVPPCKKGQMPPGCNPGHTQARPELDPNEKLEIENRARQQQQRELEQQRRELEQQQLELEQQRRELEQRQQ